MKRHGAQPSNPMGHMNPSAKPPQKKTLHTCLTCGLPIYEGQPEIQVAGLRNPVRYVHETWEGCQAAQQTPEWWEPVTNLEEER